jgi:putative two-component system response regulator
MLVDDNQTNLNIGKSMLKNSYEVYALPSAERLFRFLEAVRPDLILLDVAMPGINGFDVIKILKTDARYADIPVIFVTARTEETNELEGLTLGAADYVTKPFSAAILLKRIENQLLIEKQKAELKKFNTSLVAMVLEKAGQITELQNSVINSIAEIVEFRDAVTGDHIGHTQKYMELLINQMIEDEVYPGETLRWEGMEFIVPSTQLHDLGKIFISDAILNKPGRLTAPEYEIIKTHVPKGVAAIRRLRKRNGDGPFLRYAEVIAASHHEKWDGSGYPQGLSGEDIPLLGRLMAVADVYDALTSDRPYKKALPASEAVEMIVNEAGAHFDPALVGVFVNVKDRFAYIAGDAGDAL